MPRQNKFNARKTKRDGYIFDSQWEADRYSELRLLEMAGEIEHLEVKPPKYVLLDAFTNQEGIKRRAITYQPDFRYFDCDLGQVIVEDAKGVETEVFKIKRKLFEGFYEMILRVSKRGG